MIILVRTFALLALWFGSQSYDVIQDLQKELSDLDAGKSFTFSYTFVGCFGPYHHGSIVFERIQDTILYRETSYDDQGLNPISQSGAYELNELIELLESAKETRSTRIYGNTLNYEIKAGEKSRVNVDQISQRHFIKIFHPFSTVFNSPPNTTIPNIFGSKNKRNPNIKN